MVVEVEVEVEVEVMTVDDDSGGGRPKDAQQFGSNGHLSPQTREGNTNGEKNNIHMRYTYTYLSIRGTYKYLRGHMGPRMRHATFSAEEFKVVMCICQNSHRKTINEWPTLTDPKLIMPDFIYLISCNLAGS